MGNWCRDVYVIRARKFLLGFFVVATWRRAEQDTGLAPGGEPLVLLEDGTRSGNPSDGKGDSQLKQR